MDGTLPPVEALADGGPEVGSDDGRGSEAPGDDIGASQGWGDEDGLDDETPASPEESPDSRRAEQLRKLRAERARRAERRRLAIDSDDRNLDDMEKEYDRKYGEAPPMGLTIGASAVALGSLLYGFKYASERDDCSTKSFPKVCSEDDLDTLASAMFYASGFSAAVAILGAVWWSVRRSEGETLREEIKQRRRMTRADVQLVPSPRGVQLLVRF